MADSETAEHSIANTERYETDLFFIDIYPTLCYLFLLYLYFDVCWQRGTTRDADDQEETLINSFRELADATAHLKFEDNPAQRDRVDKLRSCIPSWIFSQNY